MKKKTGTPKDMLKSLRFAAMPVLLAALAAPIAGAACDGDALGDLAEQCGLTCPAKGIVQGNASISGIAEIDAFFGAVVDFSAAANTVNSSIRGQLDAMAASVGLAAGASAADIRGAIEAKIAANVEGSLQVVAQPPRCEASVEVTASAAAECQADVNPGSVEVKCEGSCTIDASAQASCTGESKLTCRGTAPNLQCTGKCTGECNLEVAAACEGTCRGQCNGTCSVEDANGNCRGTCDGECQGSCELSAGGTCSGQCEGSCEYTPPSGSCEATAEARCDVAANAEVKCNGGCEGKVTPPSVKAECQATVEAKASASVECKPPSLDIQWQFKGGVNAAAQAEFRAWIGNFRTYFSGMLAAGAKAEILVDAGANLTGAGQAAVEGFVTKLQGSADLKASIGAGCAIAELGNVATALEGATTGLTASAQAVVEIQGALGMQ